jgi:aminoglycoside phosphotransferase (APT) family kinase protein
MACQSLRPQARRKFWTATRRFTAPPAPGGRCSRRAFPWLRGHAKPLSRPVLVHGDFRNGNLIVDVKTGLVAVLDWELAHLGDPAEDLGWICVNSWRFGGAGPVGGFGAYADLLAGYAEGGGPRITLDTLLYWQAVGSLKWAVMCLMMYGIYASGADGSVERAVIGRRTSEAEIDLIGLMEQAQ